jgi:hypothetical protein
LRGKQREGKERATGEGYLKGDDFLTLPEANHLNQENIAHKRDFEQRREKDHEIITYKKHPLLLSCFSPDF